jgi:hypothetical protein
MVICSVYPHSLDLYIAFLLTAPTLSAPFILVPYRRGGGEGRKASNTCSAQYCTVLYAQCGQWARVSMGPSIAQHNVFHRWIPDLQLSLHKTSHNKWSQNHWYGLQTERNLEVTRYTRIAAFIENMYKGKRLTEAILMLNWSQNSLMICLSSASHSLVSL